MEYDARKLNNPRLPHDFKEFIISNNIYINKNNKIYIKSFQNYKLFIFIAINGGALQMYAL